MNRHDTPQGTEGLTMRRALWWRIIIGIALGLLGLIIGLIVHYWGAFPSLGDIARWSMEMAQGHWLLILMVIAYAALMAIPFVPGAELGIGIIALFGAAAAPVVLAATVLGLCIAYTAGRKVPQHRLTAILRRFGLEERAQYLSADANPDMTEHDRLCALFQHNRIASTLLKWRYLAIAALLNLPGNVVVGGGGGIALLAGASRAFSPIPFVIAVTLAASPIPVAIMLFGTEFLGDGLIGHAK